MSAEILVLITIFWIVCGVFGYGVEFARAQGNWPTLAERDYNKDRKFALFVGILGPIGLISVLLLGGTKHGLKFK